MLMLSRDRSEVEAVASEIARDVPELDPVVLGPRELVGMEPTLLVAVPRLLGLVGDEARRHLEPFSVIAAGSEEDEVRLAAGLR